MTAFSICIPNFNYERYLGRTMRSALAQRGDGVDVEVVVSDNCSTDSSLRIIADLGDPDVRVRSNRCNVGFAGNLDKAAELAKRDWLVMLSSDDLVRPHALATYDKLIHANVNAKSLAVTATMDQIDADDVVTGRIGPDQELWRESDRDAALSEVAGAAVFRVSGIELLRRSLATMKNPFNFAATCYRREDWQRVEGYRGARLINPDKWFHWRLLGVIDEALFVDAPLFAYRWHAQNQTAQQAATGALKFLTDEYASVLELDNALLDRAGIKRSDVETAFIERDIARHGLATLARGERTRARRILDFGRATYPHHVNANTKAKLLASLLAAPFFGEAAASVGYRLWSGVR